MGHIAADPEKKVTSSGKSVSSFVIATNNEWLDGDGNLQKSVDFHKIVAWDSLAELCARHLKKGSPVYLEGRLSNRSYEDKNHVRHYVSEVIANSLHILKWKEDKNAIETKELAVA